MPFSLLVALLLPGVCWDRVFDVFVEVFLLHSHSASFPPLPLLPVEMISQPS